MYTLNAASDGSSHVLDAPQPVCKCGGKFIWILARIDKRQFPRRVGLYPYRQHKGRKLVLGDRTEALVYILAHEFRHMHQQHGYAVHSSFPVGRVKNARGRYSEVCTEAYTIHMLRAWRRECSSERILNPFLISRISGLCAE